MKKIILFLFIVHCSLFTVCVAQKHGQALIDSLLTQLPKAKEDTNRVNIFNGLSRELTNTGDYAKAKQYADDAMAISEKINLPDGSHGFKKGIATAYNNIGGVYWQQGNYPDALKYFFNALKIFEELGNKKGIANVYTFIGNIYEQQGNYPDALKNHFASLKINEEIGEKIGIANSYHNIGIIYYRLGNWPDALKNYFDALKIFEEIGDKKGIATSYNSIGIIYYEQGNYTDALKHHFNALRIREEIGGKKGIAESYGNIGIIYEQQGNWPDALKHYFASLKIREEIGDKTGIAIAYNNIGLIYSEQGNWPDAFKNHFAALKIREELGDKKGIANCYINLGEINTKLKNYTEAKNYLDYGLSLSKEIGAKDAIKDSYKNLAVLDSATAASPLTPLQKRGEYWKDAYLHHKLFILYRDSLVNEENTKKTVQTKMQYEFDKKEIATKAEQDKKDIVQRNIRYAMIAGAAVLLLLLILLLHRYQFIQKTRKQLQEAFDNLKKAQEQLVQSEKLASLGALTAGIAHEIKNPLNFVTNFSLLSTELVDEFVNATDETERKEIAADLKMNLNKINEHGRRADSIVKNMLEHSRSGSSEKQPTDINRICEEYLNLAFHGMRASSPGFNCQMITHLDKNVPPVNCVAQDISRVILNLINNAFDELKKKNDGVLEITTQKVNDKVVIKVKDNGGGIPDQLKDKIFEPFFTTKPSGQGTGLGLSLSHDIIKSHGGTLEVESRVGEGTTFIISLNGYSA